MCFDSASQATDEVARPDRKADSEEGLFPDEAFSSGAEIPERRNRVDFRNRPGLGFALDNRTAPGASLSFWDRF